MKLVAAAIVLSVLAVVASGCSVFGGGGDGDGAGVFRLALTRPASLDPIKARTVDEQLIAEQLYDTLVRVDAQTFAPKPDLAREWAVSDDGLHWTFTLDGSKRFSNGRAITATDVKASLDRAATKGSGSVVADLMAPVTGVRAEGDSAVVVDLAAPWSALPVVLGQPAFGIVPANESASTFTRPVGSGPFQVTARERDRIVLRPVRGRRVRLAGIDIRLFADKAAAYAGFVDSRVDWSAVPTTRVDEAAARYGSAYFHSYAAELFYAFNLRNPKWADRRVREAVVRAVDTDAIRDAVYHGAMRPIRSTVASDVGGTGQDRCGAACDFDPDAARALLADVTGSGGTVPEVNIDFEDDAVQSAVAARVAEDLRAVGFTVTERPKPLADYETFAVSGEQDLFRLGWIAAYPSADAFLAPLFTTASPNNLPGYSSAKVDDLVARARQSVDPAARQALYDEADSAVLADLPIVPIGQFQQHWVANRRVRGVDLTVMGTFDAASVWLAAG